jgi:hypothetical protein
MSVYFSLCLLVKDDILKKGLLEISKYEYLGQYRDKYTHSLNGTNGHVENTRISEIIANIPNFLALSFTPEPENLTKYVLAKCDLKKDNQSVTLWLTPWMQRIFEISSTGQYFIINLEFRLEKNQSYIATDHPSLQLIQEIIFALQTIYGWLEADFTGRPTDYWGEENPEPSIEAPWHQGSNTLIIGKQLSKVFKTDIQLSSSGNGLFYCKNLGDNLYFITQPGTMNERYGPVQEDETVKSHNLAAQQLFTVLQGIPTSVLRE